jgi:hypothetical protein
LLWWPKAYRYPTPQYNNYKLLWKEEEESLKGLKPKIIHSRLTAQLFELLLKKSTNEVNSPMFILIGL